jgi:hypothetical protein
MEHYMNKIQPPQALTDWFKAKAQYGNIPRCCHSCDHYMEDGLCDSYDMKPPPEFTQQLNACGRWLEIIPF